ncbi:MAG: DNA mismatch repair protein MutS [Bacillota bacterium]
MNTFETLEFTTILEQLSEMSFSETVKETIRNLKPTLSEAECKKKMDETTQAKKVFEVLGNPPISFMTDLTKKVELSQNGSMLLPEQLVSVGHFIYACNRMKLYLKKSEYMELPISAYGESFLNLDELLGEIERCIKNNEVSEFASTHLRDIRKKMLHANENIKRKLETILRNRKDCFSDQHIVTRNGRLVLPVKRTHKSQITGTIVDSSSTGATVFIEPSSVQKLQQELSYLEIEEDSEVRNILYTLTALVEDHVYGININKECMENLDFIFAKAKLSDKMKARAVPIATDRKMKIVQGRHPLISSETCVPLDFEMGDNIHGIIITGPNTGGKTVALKTVGLLSLMAQCGLHVPVGEGSYFSMFNQIFCDIGDGQSISENLSTFSAHITNVIEIIGQVDGESLVLLDELGSGTDPTEGMGIATAILEELRRKQCLFLATTHYPEIKEYARITPDLQNACMGFDRENLKPLYQLQIGEAGISCAFHIAQKLGFPEHMLHRAETTVYGQSNYNPEIVQTEGRLQKIQKEKVAKQPKSQFVMGDSVEVGKEKEIGVVYQPEDKMGDLIVQIKGVKQKVNYKQVKLKVSARELYPEDYDFSIIFNTWEERKKFKKGYTF